MLKVFAAAMLAASPVFAGVLPLQGSYCDNGPDPAGVIVDANGVHSEDDYLFNRVIKTGKNWWVVNYKGDFAKGVTGRIELASDGESITLKDSDQSGKPEILTRCK